MTRRAGCARRAAYRSHTCQRGGRTVRAAPHAPVFGIDRLFSRSRGPGSHPGDVSSVHLGESLEEAEFIVAARAAGATSCRPGRLDGAWRAPGVSSGSISPIWLSRSVCSPCTPSSVTATTVECGRSEQCGLVPRSTVRRRRRPADRGVLRDGRQRVAFGPTALPASRPEHVRGAGRREAARAQGLTEHLLERHAKRRSRAWFRQAVRQHRRGKQAALIAVRLPEGPAMWRLPGLGVEPAAITWLDSTNPKSKSQVPNFNMHSE